MNGIFRDNLTVVDQLCWSFLVNSLYCQRQNLLRPQNGSFNICVRHVLATFIAYAVGTYFFNFQKIYKRAFWGLSPCTTLSSSNDSNFCHAFNEFLFNCSQWVDILWPCFRQYPLKYLNIISKPVQNSLTDTFWLNVTKCSLKSFNSDQITNNSDWRMLVK